MFFKKFIYLFIISPRISSNIGAAFLKDKEFEKEFVIQYGQSLYNILKNQIQAWVHVLGYKDVTLNELEIIFNIEIPIFQRKYFFSILENIIIKTNKNPPYNNEKSHQLMDKIYNKYHVLYSNNGIFWFITQNKTINNELSINFKNSTNIKKILSHFLIHRRILNKEQINYFNKNCKIIFNEEINWNLIIYGLILKYHDQPDKIHEILTNYPISENHKRFINFLKNDHKGSLNNLINNYKKNIKIHNYMSHEIFILLIKYIIYNRKNPAITHQEWIHIFKIIIQYYPGVLEDFKGVGISLFMKSMKVLLQKQIAGGLVVENNLSLKNFINYINKNREKIYGWCQDEFINPFFKKTPQEEFNLKNLDAIIKINKKNHSYRKSYMVEFFTVFLNINILYKYFNNVVEWGIFFHTLAGKHDQYHWEQSVYFMVLSYIELISKENTISKENEEKLLIYKEKLDFWINRIKQVGQISIYGQFISDKFLNNYRSNSYFALYINNFYNIIYPNTIKQSILNLNNMHKHSKDLASNISKYDWMVLLGIYVLQKEKADISLNPQTIQKDNKCYKRIINNKYSITRSVLYQWDYILNNLPAKALCSLTFLSKILIHLSIKKFPYMVMLGNAVDNKTGIVNCFGLNPKSNFLLKYKDEELRLGLLSALMKKETNFILLIDGKPNNFFDPSKGSGLFQVNFQNAKMASKKLNIYYSPERLQKDIQYNFAVVIEFLNKLIDWIGKKHIINWIISYNGSRKIFLEFQRILKIYNISNYNQEIQSLYGPFLISLIPAYVTRNYVLKVLSYFNNNDYCLYDNYINIFIKDRNSWF